MATVCDSLSSSLTVKLSCVNKPCSVDHYLVYYFGMSVELPSRILSLINLSGVGGGQGLALKQQNRPSNHEKGKPFEFFAKNFYAGCLGALPNSVDAAWSSTFSWPGSANNPPDFMVYGGDAVEVKQLQGISSIQLNSSPPKQYLNSDDPRITKDCRNSEQWHKKDFMYFIGKTTKEFVQALWLVQGRCMFEPNQKYSNLINGTKSALHSLGESNDFQFGTMFANQPNGDLACVKSVDHADSLLRVRGMWIVQHPSKIFTNFFVKPKKDHFVFNFLVTQEKFNTYSAQSVHELSNCGDPNLSIVNRQIPDPSNLLNVLDVVHISWSTSIS